jgi:hypothetical protein
MAAAADTVPPTFRHAYINAARNKIYIYSPDRESLNTGAVLSPEAFAVTGQNGTVAGTVIQASARNSSFSDPGSIAYPWVEVTVSGINESTLAEGRLTVSYEPGGTGLLQDAAGNPAEAFGLNVRSAVLAVENAYINPAAGKALIELNPGLKHFDGSGAKEDQFAYYAGGSGLPVDFNNLGTFFNTSMIEFELSFEPTAASGPFTWSFDGADSKDLANDPAASLSGQSFTAISGQPYGAVSAVYDANRREIILTFTASQLEQNITVGSCNFTLTVGGKPYTLRGFTRSSRIDENSLSFAIALDEILIPKVSAAQTLALSYRINIGNALSSHLHDLAGALVPAFGPIPAAK